MKIKLRKFQPWAIPDDSDTLPNRLNFHKTIRLNKKPYYWVKI